MSTPFAIRGARPEELPDVVAIDDEATELYLQAGVPMVLAADHPFVHAEVERWRRAIARGALLVAVDEGQRKLGFAALGEADGSPYLDQLSVLPSEMRRGIGRALLARTFELSAGRALWLTTYAHLPWNRPFYERFGFRPVPESECGPEVLDALARQRESLPHPEQRIAMVRPPLETE